jgi:hypothetical protein
LPRSLIEVGVFHGPARKADLPDFITGEVEYSELDVFSELKDQISRFTVQMGISHDSAL